MTIIVEVELMDPEDPTLEQQLVQNTGKRIRKYWAPCEATPGDGEICLFTFHDQACAHNFLTEVFDKPGGTSGDWVMEPIIEDMFYSHQFL